MFTRGWGCVGVVLVIWAMATPTVPGQTLLKAKATFSGAIADNNLKHKQKEAPSRGYFAGPQEFAKVWASWKGKAEPPKIDFDQDLVLVATVDCAANRLGLSATLDPQTGDLRTAAIATEIAGPGFAWQMIVVPRANVKTVNGQPLVTEKTVGR